MPRILIVIVALIAATLSAGALSAPALDGSHIRETTLDNGLRVIVKEEPYWGTCSLVFCIKASPLYEREGQEGLADIVRYMIFDVGAEPPPPVTAPRLEAGPMQPFNPNLIPPGAPTLAEDIEDLGGSLSSHTSTDATMVSVSLSTRVLPRIFPRLVKALFEPTFQEEVWAAQVPVIRRHFMDRNADPTVRVLRMLFELAFQKHPYGRPIPGTPDGISAYTSGDLSDFHRAYYVPNNMALIVVGDVTAEAIFALAQDTIGQYPARELALPSAPVEPEQTEIRSRLEKMPTEQTFIALGWHAAGIHRKRDVCTLDIIYALLGLGPNARLAAALSDRDKLLQGPQVEFITRRDPGLFIISWACKPEAEYETRDAVLGAVNVLGTQRVSDEDLASARELIRAGYTFDNGNYAGQASSMAFYEAIDSYRFAVDYIDEVEWVTPEDVLRVASTYLGATNYSVAVVRPRTENGETREARLTQ